MTEEQGKRKGLGRGLAALLGDDTPEEYTAPDRPRAPREVPTEQLRPGRYQPRQRFDSEAMNQLIESVREKGILQPILVRRTGPSAYEIVAGERRWRAAQKAQLHEVPVIVRELSDADALELALIENIQRQDLDAVEEAVGYQRLIDEFAYSQDQLAKVIGKSRSHIANTLRLLALPESVRAMLQEGRLSAGHARALITTKDPEALARQIVAGNLTVRQAEKFAAGTKPAKRAAARTARKDADTQLLERNLSEALGLKVQINHRGDKGDVQISYASLEQLDEICRRLSRSSPRQSEEDLLA